MSCDNGTNGTPPSGPPPNLTDSTPPDIRFRIEVGQYVLVVCLALCVWDWLLAVSDEVEMIRHIKRRIAYILHGMYFVTRICPIINFTITILLNYSSNIKSCTIFTRLIGACNIIIMPAISGIFFVRLCAVYSRDKWVIIFFGSCCVAILGIFIFDTAAVLSQSMSQFTDDNTQFTCFAVQHTDVWGYIATAAYDTLVYIAISWRLASFGMSDHWKSRVKTFVTGGELSGLSKVLLQSGQAYYFLTIGFSICTVVFIYSPAIQPEWHNLVLEFNIAISSVTACRLVRELKLGLFREANTEIVVSNVVFRDMGIVSQQESGSTSELDTRGTIGVDTGRADKPYPWDIEVRAARNAEIEDRG
ncbi:hypothetical protein PILCRDRAFT_4842 [Piloderma croceum F 1598]|uniref:DUF6533 domain-containing protein n=1 Tax=Piloderma croceum (strain F 1598) TaxID=765440 RepID=A0A0C3G398_PILCF|nr:hypothetical protein PILCRDRAFT_4842 [Piloderma croceum F 1598]